MTSAIAERVAQALGQAVAAVTPLAGGMVTGAFSAELEDGRRVVVKAGKGRFVEDQLALEGWMLDLLRRRSTLPLPSVLHAEADLLVMEHVENDGSGLNDRGQREMGELLAALHTRPCEGYGLERDTVIGPLPQPNDRSVSWIGFFRDRRLLHMASAALAEGRIDGRFFGRLERLAERLEAYLSEPVRPALLHGDLWSGNVLTRQGGVAAFIDPAISQGHPEIELAFGTLFGPFERPFFEAYAACADFDSSFFELRRDLYNLYPLLVHVRLFGVGYLAPIDRTLGRLGI